MSVVDRARASARIAALAGWTGTMVAAEDLRERTVAPDARGDVYDRWYRRWAQGALTILGVDADVDPEPPRGATGRLVVSNHRSAIDIVLMIATFGGSLLSRADLSRWPIVGPLARKSGTLFVDRGDRASGAAAIRLMRRRLESGGTVIVFPEGTTVSGDDVRPFHGGAFAAARGLDVEILPVGIAYLRPEAAYVDESFGSHVMRVVSLAETKVAACIGAPRAPKGPASELASLSQGDVQALVRAARERLRARNGAA